MLIITFLIKPFQLSTLYVVFFLYFLAKKDYVTMYIEKYWIFPSILLLFFCSNYVPLFNRVCTSLVFLLVSGTIKIIRTEWIGSADVCFLTFWLLFRNRKNAHSFIYKCFTWLFVDFI